MSRSYKKNMISKEKNCKVMKKLSNKRIRKYAKELANGKSYKKIVESYDICDVIIRYDEFFDSEFTTREIHKYFLNK